MENEFIYCRHKTPVGIRIEEITGFEHKSGRVWEIMAKQVYCENGRDGYRAIDHYDNGAPFLIGEDCRISLSHSGHLLVVATLPRTPEQDLSKFSPRAALGIDTEAVDREKVVALRSRFLSAEELAMIPENDVAANITAWTAKEAMYKAMMTGGFDFREQIIIDLLPDANGSELGSGHVTSADGSRTNFILYSYMLQRYVVTVAFCQETATFKKIKKA